jgi:hypothetical protein
MSPAGKGGQVIPIYVVVPAQYASTVSVDQARQWAEDVIGQPTDAPCIGSHDCSIEAWFRHEIGRVFDYALVSVEAPNISNDTAYVDACGSFAGPGWIYPAQEAIGASGYDIRKNDRYFILLLGGGGWAGHIFATGSSKQAWGMIGDWGAERKFGVPVTCMPDWVDVSGGFSHEFAGMLGMYVTDGYSGALYTGDPMTPGNKSDLLHYSGHWLRSP